LKEISGTQTDASHNIAPKAPRSAPLNEKGKEEPLVNSEADAFLEIIRTLPGIEYIFADTGTDHAPLLEAMAKSQIYGKNTPRMLVVPHEIGVVSMAMGFFLVSGNPQVALVHTVPGTLTAHGMLATASSTQIPLILVAGRTPVVERGIFGSKGHRIHWTQESRDQGALIRDSLKWDFEHRIQAQLPDLVYRAYRVAMSEPKGPVCIIFPREILAEKCTGLKLPSRKTYVPPSPPQGDLDALKRIVRELADAEAPLVIPDMTGRNPNSVAALSALCNSLAIPVKSTFSTMNYPTNDPMFLGQYEDGKRKESSSPFQVQNSDALLFMDMTVPWIPNNFEPGSDTKVMMIDIDPTHTSIPTWGFPADIAVTGSSYLCIQSMITEAEKLLEEHPETRRSLRQRHESISEEHNRFKDRLRQDVERLKNDRPIDFVWLSHCIGKVRDQSSIIINEFDLRPNYVEFTKPGTLFGEVRLGCLGWGLGAAIGAKLGSPETTVIAALGDGAYIAGAPVACHFAAGGNKIPVLVVIFNNQCWGASRSAVRGMYPNGFASTLGEFPGVDLKPSPDYAGIAKACGAYSETVEDPQDVEPSLRRSLEIMEKERRHVLLNVICKYPSS